MIKQVSDRVFAGSDFDNMHLLLFEIEASRVSCFGTEPQPLRIAGKLFPPTLPLFLLEKARSWLARQRMR